MFVYWHSGLEQKTSVKNITGVQALAGVLLFCKDLELSGRTLPLSRRSAIDKEGSSCLSELLTGVHPVSKENGYFRSPPMCDFFRLYCGLLGHYMAHLILCLTLWPHLKTWCWRRTNWRFLTRIEESHQVSVCGLPGFDKEVPSPVGDLHPHLHGASLTNKNICALLFAFGVFFFFNI